MKKSSKILWLDVPEDHDYPAAWNYLSLIYDEKTVNEMVKNLRLAPVAQYKAEDILRASGDALFSGSSASVKKEKEKIKKGEALDPIFLVRNPANGKVIIADGLSRLLAAYEFDEDASVSCKIAS